MSKLLRDVDKPGRQVEQKWFHERIKKDLLVFFAKPGSHYVFPRSLKPVLGRKNNEIGQVPEAAQVSGIFKVFFLLFR